MDDGIALHREVHEVVHRRLRVLDVVSPRATALEPLRAPRDPGDAARGDCQRRECAPPTRRRGVPRSGGSRRRAKHQRRASSRRSRSSLASRMSSAAERRGPPSSGCGLARRAPRASGAGRDRSPRRAGTPRATSPASRPGLECRWTSSGNSDLDVPHALHHITCTMHVPVKPRLAKTTGSATARAMNA